ncbi:glycosyltransferase [Cupriavidus sp. WS]|uniref:glycosyltransferase n=1 Tax=Cupriavidus sp. WS TaxID=1312922 RepID=UPI0003773CB3|nr:glycosyltransferase [Cupriavidus sp. WS]
MRILLLGTGLKLGGAEQQVAALARQFIALGHAVAVVSLTPGREVDVPEAATQLCLDMRKTPWSMARALWRLRGFVQDWRPDVIHAHMVHANVFARALTRIARTPPVVCTAHSFREGGRLRMLAYRLTDRWATLTTHVSADGRQGMIDAGAVRPERIVVVPNGIDIDRFRPRPELRQATRAALGLAPGARLVLNVGRLVPEKAQDLLLEAFSRLDMTTESSDRTPHLAIAGDGPERAALASAIDRLGLTGRATLLGMRRDIPELLSAADLFVLSSRIEGMPLVIAEALACGCPVVSTDAPGVADMLGDAGQIVPRGDAAALSAAMRRALEAGAGSPEAQAARRQRIAARFGIEAVARQWLDCYASLAAARGARCAEPA